MRGRRSSELRAPPRIESGKTEGTSTMARMTRLAGFTFTLLLGGAGLTFAQGTGAPSGTAGSGNSTGATVGSSNSGSGSTLPSGGVPGAGSIGGIGTPPADVQGKPNLSTPGANTRP